MPILDLVYNSVHCLKPENLITAEANNIVLILILKRNRTTARTFTIKYKIYHISRKFAQNYNLSFR